MSDLIIRQAMALKLKSDSSLSLDQAKALKPAKAAQAQSYTTKRKGYIKALPMSVLTPKASESRWALLQKGTDSSRVKNICQIEAKPKHSMGDRRLMNSIANINPEHLLYVMPNTCPHNGRGLEDLQPIFTELLRLKLLDSSKAHELNKQGTINAKQYRALKYHISKGHFDGIAKVLNEAMISNQI